MDALMKEMAADGSENEPSATHRAYQILRQKILLGDLQPGKKLKIESLRKALDMGSSPIREALSLLTSDQLVQRIDQRGFKTSPISPDNFQEILNIRCTLEEKALRDSVENSTPKWEEDIVLAHHRMIRAVSESDEIHEKCHKMFHMTLISGSKSPILMRFCSQLYDLNIRYRHIAGKTKGYPKRDVSEEHQNILDAALSGNADSAADLLLNHYKKTGNFLVGFFTNPKDTPE